MEVVENVKRNLKQNVYKTIIPRNIRLAEAPSHGLPINLYDSKSVGAESYRMLALEVIHRGDENFNIDDHMDTINDTKDKQKGNKLSKLIKGKK